MSSPVPGKATVPATPYHTYFNDILTWKNPRDSAIAYASIITLITSFQYFDIIRYALKLTYLVLGTTVAAEFVGKHVLNTGLITQFRPRVYRQISSENVDFLATAIHDFANFVLFEAQRIIFVENITVSALAFFASFVSYFLVKFLPLWVLSLVATTLAFFVPLVYATNQELIDHYLAQASEVINAQTNQLREVATKHTAQATNLTKQYMGDYTAKAQTLLRNSTSPKPNMAQVKTPVGVQEADFPAVPNSDISVGEAPEVAQGEREPLLA